MESLSEEDRRALRGSRFAPLPAPSAPTYRTQLQQQPRLAHPGGPMATNKAAALAKFLERKIKEPGGLTNINPAVLERAVKNAKDTLKASATSSGRIVRHVASFGDSLEDSDQDKEDSQGIQAKAEGSKQKRNNKKNKRKKEKLSVESPQNKKHKKKVKS